MPKKILIAPNSFKECADSPVAANYFSKYLGMEERNYTLITKPVSDGGDGFLAVCKSNFGLEIREYEISTPYDNKTFKCQVGYNSSLKEIYIESAQVLGMRLIPEENRHPINLSSKGMGELIKLIKEEVEAKKIEVDKVVIGIGGTGTNDLGIGMLPVFGWRFFVSTNNQINIVPGNFSDIRKIVGSKIKLPFMIETILDVHNPLVGPIGATRVFGLQKGSTEAELEIIENGFNDILNLMYNNKIIDLPNKLSGAGGGLAAGFKLFFDANSKTASDFMINNLGFGKLREQADYLITGEGAFDEQSLMRKGTGILIDLFTDYSEKIFLCCGKIDESIKGKLPKNVVPVEIAKYFNSADESLKNFEKGIKLACKEIKDIIQS